MEALHRQVLPFLLRRLKEDVLQDLPPKIIQDYYCELSPLQVISNILCLTLLRNKLYIISTTLKVLCLSVLYFPVANFVFLEIKHFLILLLNWTPI